MFDIRVTTEHLAEGTPDERATFGLLSISRDNVSLSEGMDTFIQAHRDGPMISGVHLGEWLLWNWWRLRYEPRRTNDDGWIRSHCIGEVGQGFVWPRLTINSDGFRCVVSSEPSVEERSFRFTNSSIHLVTWAEIESSIDNFAASVAGRLSHSGLSGTNLQRLIEDLRMERSDSEIARYRRLEAEMGFDPDELPENVVQQLVNDGFRYGHEALDEIGATARRMNDLPVFSLPLNSIESMVQAFGTPASFAIPPDAQGVVSASWGKVAASEIGVKLAQLVRAMCRIPNGPVSNQVLGDVCGMTASALELRDSRNKTIAFSLRADDGKDRVVFRSGWAVGRRFELSRILLDRMIASDDALSPSTGTKTYRQKAQRSFAAEFLAPIDSVVEFCAGDFTENSIQEVADHFSVSSMLITSLLKNNGYLPRSEADFADAA